MRLLPTIAAASVLVVATVGCGRGGADRAGTGGCGPIQHEALDPHFLVHVLGDATVQYTSDPPTSGPHQPAPPVVGVQAAPITKPIQVGLLEAGDVLIQHRTDLAAADIARLEALAGPKVVIAPAPGLHDAVVATAWVYKRTCSTVDVAGLRAFVEARVDKAPETKPSS